MVDEKRIIVGITGASGAIYGVKTLELLRELGVQTHLVMSKAAHITLKMEMGLSPSEVGDKADIVHNMHDIAASIASGSYKIDGMIVAPCSVKSLAEIATGLSTSLLSRAADVTLKERRPLVLMVRETPLHAVHLQHMQTLAQMGAVIAPPVPAFYNQPQSLDEMVQYNVARVLDVFGLDVPDIKRWS